MSSKSNSPKPRLACEISADRVLVGRLSQNGSGLEACAARELAPGSVVPDLVESNLRQRDPVVAAVEETLGSVAGRTHDVIAIVPDASVRVVLLEFDTLPSDAEEASGVVRFRMKKSLPFDVDKARVSYHTQKASEGIRGGSGGGAGQRGRGLRGCVPRRGIQSGGGDTVDAGCAGRGGSRASDIGGQSGRTYHQPGRF